ncbi:Chemotaxis protein [Desulfonema limicola]|uniref:Chemotaxis protein n=1 Tax=Desulfonema limicola TaxID=45656 RepID=A0A975GEL9_9BACT|nr:response regulator [Desulfonema limicola]QTA78270.1 Chemotaxis protein [Desulfonema limicola]
MTDKKMPVVMVIDDDEVNHLILEKIMEKDGIKAVMADNGDTGLKIARKELPDLILLDIFMPGDDGFEILRQFMSDPVLKDIPVIIFTILEREKSRKQALEMGARDYITKPFDMRDIVERIKKYLPDYHENK